MTYTDLGPGPSRTGDEAPQIVTFNLATGERKPVTHLPPVPVSPACLGQDIDCVFPGTLPIVAARFFGNTTIGYQRARGCAPSGGGSFTVAADGSAEPRAVETVALGGTTVPIFQITGDAYPVAANVQGTPVNGPGATISEVFIIDPSDSALLPGGRVLQLTNFGRSDTAQAVLSADGQRVLFIASANPPELDTNPSEQCQIFSIDRLGGDLRQITFFGTSADTRRNCQDYASPGCTLRRGGAGPGRGGEDMLTGSLLFASSCDPVGGNPTGADQFFAIRPDGSGLTQLTRTDGIVRHADGSIDVEMAEAFIPARVR